MQLLHLFDRIWKIGTPRQQFQNDAVPTIASQSQSMQHVHITSEERCNAALKPESLQIGIEQFHQNGIVVLENAVSHSSINHIQSRMLEDFSRNLSSPKVHYNHGKRHGNVTQTPPLLPEYLHEDVWANRFAVSLIEHLIGPKPQLTFATSNIASPDGQGRQAVHSDYYCAHPDFPVFLEACIYLEDVAQNNGSTEMWLGTHEGYNKREHSHDDMGWIKKEVFSERAKICPPLQPTIPKGSIVIRDLRMWHAGMPNRTSTPRIMLGFMYSPKWFGSHMRLRLPASAREVVRGWQHVDTIADFVQEDFDYLDFRQEINLSQEQSTEEYVPRHGRIAAGPDDYWTPG